MSENREMSDAEYFARAAGGCAGWVGGVLSGAMLVAAIGFTGSKRYDDRKGFGVGIRCGNDFRSTKTANL